MWLLKCIFFLSGIGFLTTTGRAQRSPSLFRFEHITVNDGLAHSDGMCAEQDKSGFIWIGTNNGINRYDGYELKKYSLPVNKLNGLSANRLRDLYTDSKNRLWAGSENAGLSLFDADTDCFIEVNKLSLPSVDQTIAEQLRRADVEVITADGAGRIWVGTHSDGVFVVVLNTTGHVVQIEQVSLARQNDKIFQVSSLVVDQDGTVWIGTVNRGIWSVLPTQTATLNVLAQVAPLTPRNIRALHIDRWGDLWIGTDQQIFWVNQANRRARHDFSAYTLPQIVAGIECIYHDSFGHLWAGTNYGLRLWEPRASIHQDSLIPLLMDKVTTFLPIDDDSFSINSRRVEQIFEDQHQILWLSAAAGGINKVNLRSKPFINLQRRANEHPTLASNTVSAILKDEMHNCLWIGTNNGFSRYDFATKTYRNYKNRPLPDDVTGVNVSAFFQASDGTLWISTRYNGIITLKGETLTTHNILPDQSSLKHSRLESIIEDKYGTIWVASFESGLLRFNRQGQLLQRFHRGNSPLPTDRFTYLLYDNDILWASTQNAGVLKLRITEYSLKLQKQFSYRAGDSTSLSINYAWPLLKDHQGRLWIGTIGGGLNQLTTDAKGQEVIQRFNRKLSITDVESLLEDDTGQLWMGGTGLVRFNPATGQWIHYIVEDGIQSNSFKVGAASTDGTLYMGGIKGITYFQPRYIKPNPFPPVVRLTELRIFNKPVMADESVNGHVILTKRIDQTTALTLRASDNDFSIDFVGLDYANPRKQIYTYRLIGYNDTWMVPPTGQRSASFANLPAGDYTLLVKAGNGEGKWSAKPVTLHITILPPWYRTWVAYLLYSLMLAGVLLGYRHVTLTQQQLKNTLALEKFQAEKEKELTDLKLRFFTNISHELRTPLTLILGPMEELASAKTFHGFKEKVILMHQQTRKLFDLVNQLMEFRKVESGHVSLRASGGNIIEFLTELYLIFKLKADELGIDYTLNAPDSAIPLYFDRSKLEIVVSNLLSNAVKYTYKEGKIRLDVSVIGSPEKPAIFRAGKLQDNYLQFTVQDWGVGMKPDEVERIFNPYYQASQTETLRIMGTGIGLSLVRQYMEAHSGEVLVQSEPGVGTVFTLLFPFGKEHLSPADIVDQPPATGIESLMSPKPVEMANPDKLPVQVLPVGTTRILVVEDNDELRHYLQQLLEPAFDVFVAVDGLDGWEKTLQLIPNLVISDIMMPRSDGLTLCQKIKQHPKTEHIPVILLTARVAAVHELEGLETGADEYMAKPFNPKILFAKIVMILQERHRLKEYYQRQILLEPTDVSIPNHERQLLEKAMVIVESSLQDPEFNVPALVRKMGMSQSVFYRQIKAITGQSVIEFIRDVRMKRAAQLLSTGSLRVSEVAAQVGMEDLQHFRKTFMTVFSVSPAEYVRKYHEPTNIN